MSNKKIGLDGKNVENQIMLESEELKEEFVKIFALYNKFDMPINIAWSKFKNIVSNRSDLITPDDTGKIAALCVDVKKEYYEKDRGIITDVEGNPDIKANVEANENFLEENPDIAIAFDEKMTETDIKVERFFKSYFKLSDNEKKEIFKTSLHSTLSNAEKSVEEYNKTSGVQDIINKAKNGEPLTEQEKKIYDEGIKRTVNYKALKYVEKYSNGENIDKIKLIKYVAALYENGNEEEKKVAIMVLSQMQIISNEIKPSVIRQAYLNVLSAEIDGSYDSSDRVLNELYKEEDDDIQREDDFTSQDINNKTARSILERTDEMQMSPKINMYEKFDSELEKRIYSQFRKIDLLNNRDNALYLLHLNSQFDEMLSEGLEDYQKEKCIAIKNVLNEMISLEENVSAFGDYIDNGEINYEKVSREIDAQKEYVDIIESAATSFVMQRKSADYNFDEDGKIKSLVLSFFKVEREKAEKVDKVQILQALIDGDLSVRQQCYLENLLVKSEEYSFLFEKGELNKEKAKEFQEKIKVGDDEKKELSDLRDVCIKFVSIDKLAHADEKKQERKENYLTEKFGSNEKIAEYDEKYNEYFKKFCLRKSFSNVYSKYINGIDFEILSTAEKKKYVTSLMYLYENGDENYKKIAEAFLKRSFGEVVLDKDGKIDRREFVSLYGSFAAGGVDSDFIESTINASIKIHGKDFVERLEKEDSLEFLKSLDYEPDINGILNSMELDRENTRKQEKYIPESQKKVIEVLEKLDLSEEETIQSLITMSNALKKNNSAKEYYHVAKAIDEFATRIENRKYFSEYINVNRVCCYFGKIDEEIVKKLELEDVDALEKYVRKNKNQEERDVSSYETLGRITSLDEETIEKKFSKTAEIFENSRDNKFCQLFITKGELDKEKVKRFVEAIPNEVKNNKTVREKFLKSMVAKIDNPEIMEAYNGDFEQFLQDFKEQEVAEIMKISEEVDKQRRVKGRSGFSSKKISDQEFEKNAKPEEMNTSDVQKNSVASPEVPIRDTEIESQKKEELDASGVTDDAAKDKEENKAKTINVEDMQASNMDSPTSAKSTGNEEIDNDEVKQEQDEKKEIDNSEDSKEEIGKNKTENNNPFTNIVNSIKSFINRVTTPKLSDGNMQNENTGAKVGFFTGLINRLKGDSTKGDINEVGISTEEQIKEDSFIPKAKVDERKAIKDAEKSKESAMISQASNKGFGNDFEDTENR